MPQAAVPPGYTPPPAPIAVEADSDDEDEDDEPGLPIVARKVAHSQVRYRCPDTGQTWSGRGLQPRWMKAALAGGKALSDLHVSPAPEPITQE